MTDIIKQYNTTSGRYDVNVTTIGKANETRLDKLAERGPISDETFEDIVQDWPNVYSAANKGFDIPKSDKNGQREHLDLSNVEGDTQATLMMIAEMSLAQEKEQNKQKLAQRGNEYEMAKLQKEKADLAAQKDLDSKLAKAAGDMASGVASGIGGGIGAAKTAQSFKSSVKNQGANDDLIQHKIDNKARTDGHDNISKDLQAAQTRQAQAKGRVDDLDDDIAGLKAQKSDAKARSRDDEAPDHRREVAREEVDAVRPELALRRGERAAWQGEVDTEAATVRTLQSKQISPDKRAQDDFQAGIRQDRLTQDASAAHQEGERHLAAARLATPIVQSVSQGASAAGSIDSANKGLDADLLRNEEKMQEAEKNLARSRMQDYESGANAIGKSAGDAVSAAGSLEQSRFDHAKQAANRF